MTAIEKSSGDEKLSPTAGDYTYILKIVQYLEDQWGRYLFISTRDFDVLYRWWEKQIPLKVVKEAIDRVVIRWTHRGKEIKSFANFSYEVKKMFQSFMELNVVLLDSAEKPAQFVELDDYLAAFPAPLLSLQGIYQQMVIQIKAGEEVDLELWQNRLLERFCDDEDLNLKVKLFLRNLAPALRNEEIAKRYRLNYLANRYGIPDLEVFYTE